MKKDETAKNTVFDIETADYVGKHDVVFGSPINDPAGGIPLGDGDTGALVWCSESALHIQLNKTDLWSDSTESDSYFCSDTEEDLTCLCHGGELIIDFGIPCLHKLYLSKFTGRLSLGDASAQINAETPFSALKFRSFASGGAKTSVFETEIHSDENFLPSIKLSRRGSRNLWRWYSQYKADASVGLYGTGSDAAKNRLYITQILNGTVFCIGLDIQTQSTFSSQCVNSHSCEARFSPSDSFRFTLFCNISLGKNTSDARKNCDAALNSAVLCGSQKLFCEHAQAWREFWSRSYIVTNDDYCENLWYLSLYYSNCECHGAYPPHFTSGIWSFYHDFMPWTYYFHYNMQHMYAPLDSACHGELAENYYLMRRRGLENACKYAKNVKHIDGALYHDVTDRYGRGARYDAQNFTPGAQIAMQMWRHYRYTGDRDFFENIALPVLTETAKMYLSKFRKESDGVYHIHDTTPYEGNPPCTDSVTDLAAAKALFGVMVKISGGDEKEKYLDILNHLPDFTLLRMDDEEHCDGKIAFGIGKGQNVEPGENVLAIGFDENGAPLRKSFGNPEKVTYGFPDVEISPVYPASILGLKDCGSALFAAVKNQILLHGEPEVCMQWCMMPIYLARMGMGDLLYNFLYKYISLYQVYPNGFNADCPMGIKESRDLHYYHTSENKETGKKMRLQAYPFRHFDMESLPIVAMAVGEALLQSYDGIIRICPASPKPAKFHLFAEGGFSVSADIGENSFTVIVESLRGEECLMKLPDRFDTIKPFVFIKTDGGCERAETDYIHVKSEKVLKINGLRKGGSVMVCSDESSGIKAKKAESPQPNNHPKYCGDAILGSPGILC